MEFLFTSVWLDVFVDKRQRILVSPIRILFSISLTQTIKRHAILARKRRRERERERDRDRERERKRERERERDGDGERER